MFGLLETRPDHPLFDLDETRRLLAELPRDESQKAMEGITFWLESIGGVSGFRNAYRHHPVAG